MKALVIYDSIYGNTEQIALAIGQALGLQKDDGILRASKVGSQKLMGLDLLIVGAPTHGGRPTPDLVKFLSSIPVNGLKGIKVASFDTRTSVDDLKSPFVRVLARLFGYAANPIASKLKSKGGDLIVPPEGFIVKGTEGPLKEGELERASDWARRIVASG